MTFKHHGHHGHDADLQALVKLAEKAPRSSNQCGFYQSVIVEVGSWVGQSALNFLKCPGVGQVYCVDTWLGTIDDPHDGNGVTGSAIRQGLGDDEIYRQFIENVGSNLLTRIIPCVGESQFWASRWPFQVDMVYIDADHRYEAVVADIRGWLPHVRSGGIICGHDFGYFPGVEQAVREVFGKRFSTSGNDGMVWHTTKP